MLRWSLYQRFSSFKLQIDLYFNLVHENDMLETFSLKVLNDNTISPLNGNHVLCGFISEIGVDEYTSC